MFRSVHRALMLLLAIFVFFSGCAHSSKKKPPQTEEEFFSKAMEHYRKKDYWQAKPVFEEIRDKFPLSQYAVLSELRLADVHYFQTEYIEAIHYYEEFKRLHPSNPNVPYAIFQLGMCHFQQIETIDRDQTPAMEAARYFEYLITHYPTSPFTGMAMGKFKICRKKMFDHEFYIGHFYFKTKKYWAAKGRFLNILANFPFVMEKDKVLFYLGQTYLCLHDEDNGQATLSKLLKNYPESTYRLQAKLLLDIPLTPEEEESLESE